jgi:AcrR family transcriptional regulator
VTKLSDEQGPPRRRPGGRSARVRSAALKATLEELAEVGYAQLSLDGVARRAGVHKTTLYRRFGTREQLLLEALLERGSERVPIPDTGSLRGDLAAYGKAIVASLRSPEIVAVARTIAATSDRDSALAETSRRFWAARLELAGAMVERAIERGEVPADTDAGVVVEAVLGAIYFRLLMSGEPLDKRFADAVADLVAAGAAGPA